jgi:hypothetical protein
MIREPDDMTSPRLLDIVDRDEPRVTVESAAQGA